MDRRTRKTIKSIKNEFIKMLAENDITSISITDLCDKCDISRSTFYSHYSDIYDLLRSVEDELLEVIRTDNIPDMDVGETTEHVTNSLYNWMKENRDILIVINNSNSYSFWKKYEAESFELFKTRVLRKYQFNDEISDQQINDTIKFINSGYVEIFKSWVLSDGKYSTYNIKYLNQISDNTFGLIGKIKL